MPWFFLGFAIAAYAGWGVLGVAFVASWLPSSTSTKRRPFHVGIRREGKRQRCDLKKDQTQMYWRSFMLQSAFSFDRMQSIGFTWTLMPFLKKIYKDTKEYSASLMRHLTFFNTSPYIVGPIVAITAELEAQRAKNPKEVDEQSIQAVKGNDGPLAGIGDSMVQVPWFRFLVV